MSEELTEVLAQIRAVCLDNAAVERKDLALRFIENLAARELRRLAAAGEQKPCNGCDGHECLDENQKYQCQYPGASTSDAGGGVDLTEQQIIDRERYRCAQLCERWIATFKDRNIQYVSASDYAVDAINDIIDLIKDGQPIPQPTALSNPAAADSNASAEARLMEALTEARACLCSYTGGPDGACAETISRIDAALSPDHASDCEKQGETRDRFDVLGDPAGHVDTAQPSDRPADVTESELTAFIRSLDRVTSQGIARALLDAFEVSRK